jgi:hypothetical protein
MGRAAASKVLLMSSPKNSDQFAQGLVALQQCSWESNTRATNMHAGPLGSVPGTCPCSGLRFRHPFTGFSAVISRPTACCPLPVQARGADDPVLGHAVTADNI